MIKEIKRAYKLVQYGLSIKMQLAFACAFALIGIAVEIATRGSQFLGGFYVALSGLFIFQLIVSVDVSTLVQSSSYKRKIQLVYPYVAVAPLTYIVFTILAVIHWQVAKNGGDDYIMQCRMIFTLGLILCVTVAYFGICYKYFVAGMIGMFILVYAVMIAMARENSFICRFASRSYSVSLISSYILITLGLAIAIILSQITYKKDFSKLAFERMLKRNAK